MGTTPRQRSGTVGFDEHDVPTTAKSSKMYRVLRMHGAGADLDPLVAARASVLTSPICIAKGYTAKPGVAGAASSQQARDVLAAAAPSLLLTTVAKSLQFGE